MNREEIKNIIPHREPMLLIDEAELVGGDECRGSYTVSGGEWFLNGHFPGNPVVPGVIQCEMAAQCCSVLFKGMLEGKLALFAGINNVKFKRIVLPGDTLEFNCRKVKERHPFYFVKATAMVKGQICIALTDAEK